MQLDERIEARIGRRLIELGATLATAESCSGGLIAHRITNVAGSSAYFLGGAVAYANEVKEALLGVDGDVLEAYGAVSEPVARQMAEGARKRFGAEYAVACTGIAGPSGGTAEKPVGLVYIAVAGGGPAHVARHVFEGDRESVKNQTAQCALDMLWERLA